MLALSLVYTVQPVDTVEPVLDDSEEESTMVRLVGGDAEFRIVRFKEFLGRHHQAFCLEPGERGETDLVQMEINTLDTAPRRQLVR